MKIVDREGLHPEDRLFQTVAESLADIRHLVVFDNRFELRVRKRGEILLRILQKRAVHLLRILFKEIRKPDDQGDQKNESDKKVPQTEPVVVRVVFRFLRNDRNVLKYLNLFFIFRFLLSFDIRILFKLALRRKVVRVRGNDLTKLADTLGRLVEVEKRKPSIV